MQQDQEFTEHYAEGERGNGPPPPSPLPPPRLLITRDEGVLVGGGGRGNTATTTTHPKYHQPYQRLSPVFLPLAVAKEKEGEGGIMMQPPASSSSSFRCFLPGRKEFFDAWEGGGGAGLNVSSLLRWPRGRDTAAAEAMQPRHGTVRGALLRTWIRQTNSSKINIIIRLLCDIICQSKHLESKTDSVFLAIPPQLKA